MQTKFKIDENLPAEVAGLLKQEGFDALTVHDEDIIGSSDSQIALICQREKRSLVTLDTDFADISTYPPMDYSGLIILRLKTQDKRSVLDVFQRLIKVIPEEKLEHQLWIVDENRVRVRE
jgi:predicted nuclease of predicted toxin-antitoxin system